MRPGGRIALVGRGAERAALDRALERAGGGRAGGVLLAGDAGVGKSRLVRELTAQAGEEVLVLVGRCIDTADSALPYLPFTEVVSGLLGARPELAERFPGLVRLTTAAPEPERRERELGQLQVFEALLSALGAVAAERPVLLVLEDLHWADRSTRDLLVFLLSRLGAQRLLVLATYRSDDLHRRHPLRPVLAELVRLPAVERIDLAPLPPAEARELVSALAAELALGEGEVRRLAARSEGNAFFAEELVSAARGGGGLPEALADVLLARFERLPEPARQVLRVASVAGSTVPDGTLAAVSGLGTAEYEAAVHEAVAHQVLVIEPTGDLAFRHALLREAVYQDLLPGERSRLHLRYADLLSEVAQGATRGGRSRAAALAHHALAAHDLPRGLDASVRAAFEADRYGAPAEVLRHAERALELWPAVPGAEELTGTDEITLTLLASWPASATGDPERGIALSERALELADRAGDPLRAGEVRIRHAIRLLDRADTGGEAAVVAREAVRLLGGSPDGADDGGDSDADSGSGDGSGDGPDDGPGGGARAGTGRSADDPAGGPGPDGRAPDGSAPGTVELAWAHSILARALWRTDEVRAMHRHGVAALRISRAAAAAIGAGHPPPRAHPGIPEEPADVLLDAAAAEADALITLAVEEEFAGRGAHSRALLSEALPLARRSGNIGVELRIFFNRGMSHLEEGAPAAAVAEFALGGRRATETGTTWSNYGMNLRVAQLIAEFVAGDWEAAERTARLGGAMVAPVVAGRLAAAGLLVTVARGGLAEAERRWAELSAADPDDDQVVLLLGASGTESALRRGDPAEALRRAEEALARLRRMLPHHIASIMIAALGLGALPAGADPEPLLEIAEDAARQGIPRSGTLGVEGLAWLARARAEANRVRGADDPGAWAGVVEAFGDFEPYREAEGRVRRAEALLAGLQRRTETGRRDRPDPDPDRTETGAAERRDGAAATGPTRARAAHTRDEAVAELDRALEIAERLGAAPLAALAAEVRARAAPVQGEEAGHGPLTPREHAVLGLVAEGRTNRQVGEELFISEKTVSVHLTRVMAKLAAGSRTEAVAVGYERGLVPYRSTAR
ncbi:AAA family ATPase [Pseudonocardia ailaonensis]|uniref:AAA family ATPase n=1 Tax=Pseudonocardia ailaonensis TaxID=367279 RepID=UPI0031D0CB4D